MANQLTFPASSTREDKVYFQQLSNYLDGLVMTSITELSQTISNPPTQGEVQAISNKIDEIIIELKDKGLME